MKILVSTMAMWLLMGAAPGAASHGEAPRDTVLRVERERLTATISRDVTLLKQLTTADLNYVHAGGQRQNQAQYLAYIQAGSVTLASYSIESETIKIVGDTAVTHGLFTYTTAATSDPARSGKTLFSAVYFRDGGHWRLHAWEATKAQ